MKDCAVNEKKAPLQPEESDDADKEAVVGVEPTSPRQYAANSTVRSFLRIRGTLSIELHRPRRWSFSSSIATQPCRNIVERA